MRTPDPGGTQVYVNARPGTRDLPHSPGARDFKNAIA
jgi:hypothetical protein